VGTKEAEKEEHYRGVERGYQQQCIAESSFRVLSRRHVKKAQWWRFPKISTTDRPTPK